MRKRKTGELLDELNIKWKECISDLSRQVEDIKDTLGNLEYLQDEYRPLYRTLKAIMDVQISDDPIDIQRQIEELETPNLDDHEYYASQEADRRYEAPSTDPSTDITDDNLKVSPESADEQD